MKACRRLISPAAQFFSRSETGEKRHNLRPAPLPTGIGKDSVFARKVLKSALALALTATLGMAMPLPAAEPPAGISDVSLVGEIEGENIVFTLRFTTEPRSRDTVLPLVDGDTAYLDSVLPAGAEVVRDGDRFLLRLPRARRLFRARAQPVEFRFAARPVADGEWRHTSFAIPVSPIRRISVFCDRDDLDVRFPGALDVERVAGDGTDGGEARTRVTGWLGVAERFVVRWKPDVRKLDAELAAVCEAHTVATAGVGALRMNTVFVYRVIQGALTEVSFALPDIHVTRVLGDHIQDWRIDPEQKRLVVTLNRPQTQGYRLQVESEMALPAFPCRFSLPALTPERMLRTSGFLLVGTDSAIRLQVERAAGLTQTDAAALPKIEPVERGGPRPRPARALYAWQFANMPYSMDMSADDIVTVFTADTRLVLSLSERILSLRASVELDIKEAPARELIVETDADAEWTLTGASGRDVAAADADMRETDGQRAIHIPFRKAVLGTTLIEIQMERALPPDVGTFQAPTFRAAGARSERGFLVVAAEKGIRLKADRIAGLREAHTGSVPVRVPNAQQAFRFRSPDWTASFAIERAEPVVHSEIFHLATLSQGIKYGSAAITYHIAGAPVQDLKVLAPADIARVEFAGADIEGWTREGDLCTVRLQTAILGDYTLLVSYDRPFSPDRPEIVLAPIETVGTETEVGYAALASSASLSFRETAALPASVFRIDRDEIPAEYAALVMDPIIAAYQYTHAPHRIAIRVERFPTEPPLGQIADYIELSTVLSEDGESVTTANLYVKNATRQHLVARLPQNASLWSVHTVAEDGAEEPVLSQQDGDSILIPVRRPRDPNTALHVRIVYAQALGPLGFWRSGIRSAALAGPVLPDTHAAFARWSVSAPAGYSIAGASGTLEPEQPMRVNGLADTLAKSLGLIRALFDRHLSPREVLRDGWGGGQTVELTRAVHLADAAHPEIRLRIVPAWIGARGTARGLLAGLLLGGVVLARASRRRAAAPWHALGWTFAILGLAQTALGRASLSVLVLLLCLALFLLKGGPQTLWRTARRIGRRLRARRARAAATPEPAPASDRADEEPDDLFPFDPPSAAGPQPDASNRGGARIGLLLLAVGVWLAAGAAALATPSEPAEPVMDSVRLAIAAPDSAAGPETGAEATLTLQFRTDKPVSFLAVPVGCVLKEFRDDSRRLRVEISPQGYMAHIPQPGAYEVSFVFQAPVVERDGQRSLALRLPPNLRNRVELTLPETGLDVRSEQAVLFATREEDNSTVAEAVYGPARTIRLHWRPRMRRMDREPVVFFSEVHALALLRPGLAETLYGVRCQIAQGEIRDLKIRVPAGMTVTAAETPRLATWSFDPAERLLEIVLDRPVTGELKLWARAQIACDGLPYEANIGVLETLGATRQRGTLALAAPESVQVRLEAFEGMTPMNLEDFSEPMLAMAVGKPESGADRPVARRAFRYHRPAEASARFRAEQVPPEIRVRESGALTLADERIALATRLRLSVAKAGVFSADLLVPADFEVETLTGPEVSHWDERGTVVVEDGADEHTATSAWTRVTVHFRRPILGDTDLNLVVARTERGIEPVLTAPRAMVDGARSHRGRLVVSGERGVRLMVKRQTGVEMKKASEVGIRQAGVLVFDLHRPDWRIVLSAETLEPVVRPTILHHVAIAEGMLQYRAYLDYAIENAGVKTFLLRSPVPEASLAVTGRGIARAHPVPGEPGLWQVDLHDRVEDRFAMRATFQAPFDRAARRVTISPLRAVGAEAARGFLAVSGGGRAQIATLAVPESLRIMDPRNLPPDFGAGDLSDAVLCYEALDPDYALDLSVVRHESADAPPAVVEQVRIVSALAADGKTVTRVQLALAPGPLRLLKTELPPGSDSLWLALVNGKEVAVSRDGSLYCIPLDTEEDARTLQVDFLYASSVGRRPRARHTFDAPRFEGLPLRDVEWRLFVPANRTYYGFDGNMDRRADEEGAVRPFDAQRYLARNRVRRESSLQEAGRLLDQGARLMHEGRQREAREALRAALAYSQGEADLNEDARVQFRHLQTQQAKMGLFERRGNLRAVRNIEPEHAPAPGARDGQYSPEYIARVEQALSARDRSSLDIVADRIVARQDAARETVSAIRMAMPEHGRQLVFRRDLHIDPETPLAVAFRSGSGRLGRAASEAWPALFLFAGLALTLGKRNRKTERN